MGDSSGVDDAAEHVNAITALKIDQNNDVMALLALESNILKKGILINYRWIQHNEHKIGLIQSINALEEQQKIHYCRLREIAIHELVARVNACEVDVGELQQQIFALSEEGRVLMAEIAKKNAKIPDVFIVRNFILRQKG